ncbi:MAG: hypothetical protein LBU65_11125, partial [Planctomycetaceae bacterium]|nr:hypothetical protein [Planctomycetaceae bacterium]
LLFIITCNISPVIFYTLDGNCTFSKFKMVNMRKIRHHEVAASKPYLEKRKIYNSLTSEFVE